MTTKHAKLKSALTRAIIDFFLREDLYADELSIQGTVCITADRTSTFVTQITETITEGDVTGSEGKSPVSEGRRALGSVSRRSASGTLLESSSWHVSSNDVSRGEAPWVTSTPLPSHRPPANEHYSSRPQDLSKITQSTVHAVVDSHDADALKSPPSSSTNVAQHFGGISNLTSAMGRISPKTGRKDSNAGVKPSTGLDSLKQLADFATNLRFDRNPSSMQDRNPGVSPTLESLSKTLFASRDSRRESSGSTSSGFSLPSVQDEPLGKRSRLDSEISMPNMSRPNAPYRYELPKVPHQGRRPSLDDQECVLVIDENSDKPGLDGSEDRVIPSVEASKFPCLPSSTSSMTSVSSSQFSPLSDSTFSQNLSHALTKYTNMLPNHANPNQQGSNHGDPALLRQQVFEEMALAASWQAMSGYHGDEGSENTSNEWTRKARTKFSPEQLQALEEEYARDPFLSVSSERRAQLAQKLNITERNVQIWFQNQRRRRRAREYCAFTYKPETAASSTSGPENTSTTFDSLAGHGHHGKFASIVSTSSSAELSYTHSEVDTRSVRNYPAFSYKPDLAASSDISRENLSSAIDGLECQESTPGVVSPSYRGDVSSYAENNIDNAKPMESNREHGGKEQQGSDTDTLGHSTCSTQKNLSAGGKLPKEEPSNGHLTSCNNSS